MRQRRKVQLEQQLQHAVAGSPEEGAAREKLAKLAALANHRTELDVEGTDGRMGEGAHEEG